MTYMGPWQRGHGQVVGWFKDEALGCWRRLVEQKTAEWQQVFSAAVGQPAEVADAGEASG